MFRKWSVGVLVGGVAIAFAATGTPQAGSPDTADAVQKRLASLEESLRFAEQALAREADEATIFRRLEDVAVVDKVRYTGPPPRVVKNPTAPGAKNPVIVP